MAPEPTDDEPPVSRSEIPPPASGRFSPRLPFGPSTPESLAPSTRPSAPVSSREPFGPASRRRAPTSVRPGEVARGPAAPWAPKVSHLTPRMTAVFGALFGLACVTSIVALLIQGTPTPEERAAALTAAAPAAESAAPEPEAPPSVESRKPQRTPLPSPWRIKDLANDASVVILTDHIERRAFVKAVQEKGVPKAEVYRVLKAFDGVKDFDKTNRKDRFIVAMDRASKKIRAFEYEISPLEIYQAREDDQGLLRGDRLDLKIAEAEVVAAFYIGDDLKRAYEWGGLEPGILDEINDALNGRISTESFEEGGVVRLIATEVTALGMFAKYKQIVALEYRPPNPEEKPIRAYYFEGDKAKGYFDERGRQPFTGGWRSPCPDAPVTSRFNPKRMHPVLKKVMPHNGTDFGAPAGTPVHAAYRGKVLSVGFSGASGNLVTIQHPNGIVTGYAHLSKFEPGLKVGDQVGTFQTVGYVGSTGRSTGPHLHFSAKRDGKFFDAETLRMDGVRVMPVPDRPGFLARKAELDMRLDGIPLPEPPPPEPKAAVDATPGAGGAGKGEPGAGAGSGDDDRPDGDGPDEPGRAPAQAPTSDATKDDDEGSLLQGPDLGE